ncbi:DsrE family protein [Comamonas composti]|uniref:DsrE family protein n=1 Tax=Comamonas composti TaxID=408558 RepID=UPI00047E0290|nr:hypothetical protein [Comamonas composti]
MTSTDTAALAWAQIFPAPAADKPLRIVLHAPTPGALARARSNLGNLRQDLPDAQLLVIVNGPGVEALLDAQPGTPQDFDAPTLAYTGICPNTLKKLGRSAEPGMQVLPQGGIESLARLQAQGWSYIRC